MGMDISITLGRVKQLAIGHDPKERVIILSALRREGIRYSQFEFMNYSAETMDEEFWHRTISRNYNLFSWLGVPLGDILPLMENSDKLKDLTRSFIDWLKFEWKTAEKAAGTYSSHKSDFVDQYINGDHSLTFYPLALLADFDYDQLVRPALRDAFEDSEGPYLERLAEFSKLTYRQIFPKDWFEFLKWATENKWDFVIFSYG